jgi:hypothetical protein
MNWRNLPDCICGNRKPASTATILRRERVFNGVPLYAASCLTTPAAIAPSEQVNCRRSLVRAPFDLSCWIIPVPRESVRQSRIKNFNAGVLLSSIQQQMQIKKLHLLI